MSDTLRHMQRDLPTAAALLPAQLSFDTIGYCCTSAATMIGEDKVADIIREIHPSAQVSNPITACKAALAALNIDRIAVLTPYAPDVTNEMQANLEASGIALKAERHAELKRKAGFPSLFGIKAHAMIIEEIHERWPLEPRRYFGWHPYAQRWFGQTHRPDNGTSQGGAHARCPNR